MEPLFLVALPVTINAILSIPFPEPEAPRVCVTIPEPVGRARAGWICHEA